MRTAVPRNGFSQISKLRKFDLSLSLCGALDGPCFGSSRALTSCRHILDYGFTGLRVGIEAKRSILPMAVRANMFY